MSRVANNPVVLPSGVEVKLNGQEISVKGSKGALQITIHQAVEVKQEENVLNSWDRALSMGHVKWSVRVQ